jgi:hypothetical protein
MNRACPVLTLLGSDAVIRHGMTLASSQILVCWGRKSLGECDADHLRRFAVDH